MSTHDERPDDGFERELESAFETLRREDRSALPAHPTPEARTAPAPLRWGPWLAGAAAAAAAGLLLWADGPDPAPPLQLAWHAPTDFLLETPGAWLLEPAMVDPTAGLIGDLAPKGEPR